MLKDSQFNKIIPIQFHITILLLPGEQLYIQRMAEVKRGADYSFTAERNIQAEYR